nr:hypothetical protein 10 [Saccharospirillaceae bacterium]
MLTKAALEQRLEEWAIWVQGGAVPVNLGYSCTAPGFSDSVGGGDGHLVTMSRQEAVEAAVMQLQVLGHGVWDSTRHKWIHKPRKRYAKCAEVLRAEYRAHPAYGDARFEEVGNDHEKTLKRLGMSRSTYHRKLALSLEFLLTVI